MDKTFGMKRVRVANAIRGGLLTVGQAQELFVAQVSRRTILRWMQHGVNGTRLKCVRQGWRYYTRREWVEAFKQVGGE